VAKALGQVTSVQLAPEKGRFLGYQANIRARADYQTPFPLQTTRKNIA